MKKCTSFCALVICLFFALTGSTQNHSPNYEFRGVWVATVANIDWPSSKTLSVVDQKNEYIKLLEMHQRNGMNAIVMQVRPSGDAIYPSSFEPWSEFLSGQQGKAPSPFYDPLEFMITETHKRGMEFHAWINPYRAIFNMNNSSIADNHLTKTHPEWFLVYGDKKYFNPSLPQVRSHMGAVVKDLISRYDIDGLHMDDYFYPYRITGKEFPDQKDFLRYGNGMEKNAWRRSNVDSIIYQVFKIVRSTKPSIKFGISPFGVWRNKSQDPMGSDTKAGQTNYDDLYADILLWLDKGWIDYVVPQLYWERGHKLAEYDVLLDWWNQHSYGKHLYIGHGIYRANSNLAWKNPNEIPNQIKQMRSYPSSMGSIYFSSKTFEKNPLGWNDSLINNYYKYPALVPPMHWIDNIIPTQPMVEKKGNQIKLSYQGSEPIKAFALLMLDKGNAPIFQNAQLIKIIVADKSTSFNLSEIAESKQKQIYAVTVDKDNNVSEMILLN